MRVESVFISLSIEIKALILLMYSLPGICLVFTQTFAANLWQRQSKHYDRHKLLHVAVCSVREKITKIASKCFSLISVLKDFYAPQWPQNI